MKGLRVDSREMRPSTQNERLQFLSKAVSSAKHILMGFREGED